MAFDEILPASGVGNVPGGGLYVLLPWNAISLSSGAVTSGTVSLYPIDVWPGPLTVSALTCQVTTAQVGGTGTLNQLVVYRDRGNGSGAAVTAAGLVANVAVTATSTGVKSVALPSNVTLQPGRYWVGSFYYAGSTAPTTPPQYSRVATATTLYTSSGLLTLTTGLQGTSYTTVPSSGSGFPVAAVVAPLVGLVAA